MYLTDTHCHLNLNQFDNDLNAVLIRSAETGIRRILVPGIDLESSRKAVQLAESFPQIFAAVGIHPNTPDAWQSDTYTELKALALHPKVAAIGEIGLDNHWHDTDSSYQKKILQAQLDLAAEVQKPVVIHSREAFNDLVPILNAWTDTLQSVKSPLAGRPGVLHAFEGDSEDAGNAIKAGFFIGLAGPITFQNARIKHQLAIDCPLVNIVIETDAPYLTPHPYRGQRNEPARVALVAAKLAELKQVSFDKIIETTTVNANRLFSWSN